MPQDPNNPFAPPKGASLHILGKSPDGIDPAVYKKAETIIKDADQFGIAMCIFCSGVGVIIIEPWHLVRLIQWFNLSSREPMLLNPNPSPESISRRFRKSRSKLIIGLIFGAVMLLLFMVFILFSAAPAP